MDMSDQPFSQDKLAGTLEEDQIYKTLLESTLAIPWKIDWATKEYRYVGPQIEKLLGWLPSSWKSVEDWATRMHPEDRARIVDMCVAQSIAGIDHEADYRALTASGNYIWVREVVHVVRDAEDKTESLVGFMFDISERKKQEQELERLRTQLEEYSYQDGLTGIANRRLFNELFHREWLSAIREQRPLSMIMFDIDYFKNYNDHYGHIQGDACLQEVAKILKSSLSRPRDVVARFGGEEFVMILPDTSAESVAELANRILQNIRDAHIEHAQSPIAPHVTISMGVKTAVIEPTDDKIKFLHDLDRALYRAKRAGRNCYLSEPT